MASDPIRTLMMPFERGEAEIGGDARGLLSPKALFLRAEAHPSLLQRNGGIDWRATLTCVQGLKPAHDALLAQGFGASAELSREANYDLALVRVTKHKQESLGLIAQGLQALKPGGALHVAGAKDEGIESIEKRVKALIGEVITLSKHHARSFFLTRGVGPLPADISAWADAMRPAEHVPGFITAPGMFSFDKIDAGSRLLSDRLPSDLSGSIADFGAGWGYLSKALLPHSPSIKQLDLYEAEASALSCARLNLAGHAGETEIGFHWTDVTAHAMPAKRYDAIVMNPPFHAGGARQVSLGAAFITAAARALKPGGRLFMVANAMLPYERTIEAAFSSSRLIVRVGGFKVIEARR